MRLHIFFNGHQPGTLDIDKKIPMLTKIYPDSKIEKITKLDKNCIFIEDIAKDLTVVEFLDKKVKNKVKIDCYAFSELCFTYFDMSFEIDELKLSKNMSLNDFLPKSKILINGETKTLAAVVFEFMLPYYDVDNILKVDQSLDSDLSELTNNLDTLYECSAIKCFSIIGKVSGMSLTANNTKLLIEDYNNDLDLSNLDWVNISENNSIWDSKNLSILLCKQNETFKKLFNHNLMYCFSFESSRSIRKHCNSWLDVIRSNAISIRENIVIKHSNLYYWKELKQKIEVMDLNFLEFHTHAYQLLNSSFDDNLNFNSEYLGTLNEKVEKHVNSTFKRLDEIKYAISNLSTPSHTHDEDILQQETEKVNDRILMLSFIAMAVSAIGMMRSPGVTFYYKLISGISIFSLPLFYYSTRMVMKKISFNRNKKTELNRQLKQKYKSLKNSIRHQENMKNDKDIPADFQEEVIAFHGKFVEAEKKSIDRLKAKI